MQQRSKRDRRITVQRDRCIGRGARSCRQKRRSAALTRAPCEAWSQMLTLATVRRHLRKAVDSTSLPCPSSTKRDCTAISTTRADHARLVRHPPGQRSP